MVRRYFVADDLDELKLVEQELESIGIAEPHIQVLSESEADVERHHLHAVKSVFKRDVVHSSEVGAIIGIVGALATIGTAYVMGWTNSAAGWMPFIFLAVIVLGFCTWEGGFIGIQKVNVKFKPFQAALRKGKHILLVDTDTDHESALDEVIRAHPHLQVAGVG